MKRCLVVFLSVVLPVALYAAPGNPYSREAPGMERTEAGEFYKAELAQIQSEMGTEKLGDFSVQDFGALRDRLSIAAQKDEYVRTRALHSAFLPGLGHFEMGDAGTGLAFLGADLATLAGTITLAYFLLPADLRFDRIDYFRNSFSTINNAWENHSLVDYLPSLGALLGGAIIDGIIRHWASSSAKGLAREAVIQGKVDIKPRVGIGFMGVQMEY